MQTPDPAEPIPSFQEKTPLGHLYLYYCGLCDELLSLQDQETTARKLILHYQDCPGCGYPLQQTLAPEPTIVPLYTASSLTLARLTRHSTPIRPTILKTPTIQNEANIPPIALDPTTQLHPGQLTVLQGQTALDTSFSLLVQATAPVPVGFNTLAAWLDGGNSYDLYHVSRLAIQKQVNPNTVQERILISRAFTYHQLHNLITEKLPLLFNKCSPDLVIISDLTALFCDPDVKNFRDATDTFSASVKSLAYQAEQRKAIIITTIPHSRNKPMEEILFHTAHSTISLGHGFETGPRPRKRKQTPSLFQDRKLTQFTRQE